MLIVGGGALLLPLGAGAGGEHGQDFEGRGNNVHVLKRGGGVKGFVFCAVGACGLLL